MSNEGDCKTWISVYVYFQGDIYEPECDKVILNILEPFINLCRKQNLFEKYFFIRYSEYGNHIRLRFFGNQNILNEKIKPSFEKYIYENENKNIFTLPKDIPVNTSPCCLLWRPYEPELERYGGIKAIQIAEEFFYYSSNTAIKLLKKIPGSEQSSRLGKGLLSMIVLLFVFVKNRDEAIILIQNYGENYLKATAGNEKVRIYFSKVFDNGFDNQSSALVDYTNMIWDCLEENGSLPEELEEYKNNLTKVADDLKTLVNKGGVYKDKNVKLDWQSCIRNIIPSYIHMMNNRLGISIRDESYLSHLIYKSLETKPETEYEIKK